MSDAPLASGFDHTRALLARARQGDEDARDALFTRALPPLRVYIRLRLGAFLRQKLEPEDVLQETLAAALPALSGFEPAGPGALVGWLCRIAERQIAALADHHGARKRSPGGAPVPWSQVATRLLAQDAGPASAAHRADELRQLEAALLRLPDADRQALLLHHFQGLTVRDLAAAIGQSATATHRLLGRSLAVLGRELGGRA